MRVVPTAPPIMAAQASFLRAGVCGSFTFPAGVAGVTPASVLPSRVGTRQAPLNWLEVEVREPEGHPPPFLPCSHIWHLPSWCVVCTSTEEKVEGLPLGQMAWVPTEAPPQTSPLTSALSFLGCSHHLQRFLEPKKIKSVTVSIVSPSICQEVMRPDAMIFVF